MVDLEEHLVIEEDIKIKRQEGVKVLMVTTSNIVDPIIKEEVEAEQHEDQALKITK